MSFELPPELYDHQAEEDNAIVESWSRDPEDLRHEADQRRKEAREGSHEADKASEARTSLRQDFLWMFLAVTLFFFLLVGAGLMDL